MFPPMPELEKKITGRMGAGNGMIGLMRSSRQWRFFCSKTPSGQFAGRDLLTEYGIEAKYTQGEERVVCVPHLRRLIGS